MNWGRAFSNLDYGFILPAIARLPVPLADRLSDLRAWIRFRRRHASREQALRNLTLAFPDLPIAEARRIVLESFRNQARDEMQSPWFDQPLPFLESLVEVEQLEVLREAVKRGRGVLLTTGHMGIPGIFLALVGRLGFNMNLVFRSPDDILANPEAWIRYGKRRIAKLESASGRPVRYVGKTSYFALRRMLRAGETVMMAIDVVPSLVGRTVTSEFFGRPSSFAVGSARLYLDTRPAVVFWSSQRRGNGKFQFLLTDLTGEFQELNTLEEVNQHLVSRLEENLRRQPGLWMQWDALDQFFVKTGRETQI